MWLRTIFFVMAVVGTWLNFLNLLVSCYFRFRINLEVMTLAHAHVPSEYLGFRLVEGDQRPIFDVDVPADEMQDGEDQPQPVDEARALKRPSSWWPCRPL